MKVLRFLSGIIIVLVFYSSCASIKLNRTGLVSLNEYFINIKDSNDLPAPDNLESKIWFKDSCVIYEVKTILVDTKTTNLGTVRKVSYEFLKYTYLDLRNLKCQDYKNFSDTAQPVSNYILSPDEELSWNFYRKKRDSDIPGDIVKISDTILQGKKLQRLKTVNRKSNYECVFYLDCESKNNMFHLNPSLDEKCAPCQVVRSELYGDLASLLAKVVEVKLIKDKLNSTEETVFNSWTKNAQETKLPIITRKEASKRITLLPKNSADTINLNNSN